MTVFEFDCLSLSAKNSFTNLYMKDSVITKPLLLTVK